MLASFRKEMAEFSAALKSKGVRKVVISEDIKTEKIGTQSEEDYTIRMWGYGKERGAMVYGEYIVDVLTSTEDDSLKNANDCMRETAREDMKERMVEIMKFLRRNGINAGVGKEAEKPGKMTRILGNGHLFILAR